MLTFTASYDEVVNGDPIAPTLTIGGTAIPAVDLKYSVRIGSTRIWTYTISKDSPSGSITLTGGDFLADSDTTNASHAITDAADNKAEFKNGVQPSLMGTFTADSSAPATPTLNPPPRVKNGGATRDEATATTGVVFVKADSGNTVVLTFSDKDNRTVSKTVTATAGSGQGVTLDAADIYSGSGSSTAQLHDGSITVSAIARNSAGSNSNPGLTNFTLDTDPPHSPDLNLADGTSDGVSKAEATAPKGVLTVSAEAGSKVVLTFATDATHSVSKTVTATGFAQAVTLLAGDLGTETGHLKDGTITVTAIATDAAGNDSEASTQSFTLKTDAPSINFSGLSFNRDTGPHMVDNTDFITSIPGQTITATLSWALDAGDVLKGSLDGGASWENITAKIDLQDNKRLIWTGATLLTGKHNLRLKVTDAAGNDGPLTTQPYELDQTAPTQFITTAALSNDTAPPTATSKNTDFITKTASQNITATLSAPLGVDEILWGSLDSGVAGTWVPLSEVNGVGGFLTGTGTQLTSLAWANQTLLASGSHSLKLKITDKAGNENPGLVFSQDYEVRGPTTAPTTQATAIRLSADTGRSSTDYLTNQEVQILQGTLNHTLQQGESVYVSVDAGSNWGLASTSVTTFSVGDARLNTGSNTFHVRVFDVAGNPGPVFTQTYTLDTSAPDAPSIDLGTGVSGGATSAEATQTGGVVTVTAESGASVVVTFRDGGGRSVVRTLLANGLAQIVTLDASDIGTGSQQLHEGTIAVEAVATDTAGNQSNPGERDFKLDTFAQPPVFERGAGVDNGATKAEATASGGVVKLTSESGATVAITFSDGVHSVFKSLTGNGSAQAVTLNAADIGSDNSQQLRDGTITVSATATDQAGNINATPSTITFRLDTTPPPDPVLALIPAVTNGASLAEATASVGVVSVVAEIDATVLVTFRDGTGPGSHAVIKAVTGLGVGSAVKVTLEASDLGTGSNQLHDGSITVTAIATDVAGNPSDSTSAVSSCSFRLDTAPPAAPVILLGADVQAGANLADALQSSGVVRVNAESGSTVNLAFSNGSQSVTRLFVATGSAQAVTLNASDIGMGSNQLQDGSIRVTVTATDVAGNSSTSTSSFVLDTRYVTTQLLSLGSGVAGLSSLAESMQASGVVTLHAELGSSVWVTFTDANNTSIVKMLVGTGVPGQAVVLSAADIGSYANQLHDGTINVSAVGRDSAGNVSTALTSFVLDTHAPAQASVVMRKKPDNVFSLADITSPAGLFQFNTEAGASVRAVFTSTNAANVPTTFSKTYAYNDSLAGTAPWQAATLAASDIGTGANQLRPGTVSVTLVTVDAAGNESAASASTTFTLDTSTYSTTVLTLINAAVDTTAPSVEIALDKVQTWSNTVPAGHSAIIQFSFSENPGSSFTLNSLASSTGGTFSNLTGDGVVRYATFTPTPNTNNGSATILVAAGSYSDAAGNAGTAASPLSLDFDTAPPTPPILRQGAGIEDGATAAEATQASGVFTVQAESGQTVVLTFTGTSGSPVLKSITGSGMGSAVPVVLAASDVTALHDGTITVSAVATDAAGNSSHSNSSYSTFTLDTSAISNSAFTFAA